MHEYGACAQVEARHEVPPVITLQFILRQNLQLGLELLIWLGCRRDRSVSACLSLGLQVHATTMGFFCIGAGDLKSSIPACIASTLPSEPPPLARSVDFNVTDYKYPINITLDPILQLTFKIMTV